MNFDEVKCLIEEFFNGKFEVKKFLGEGSFAKVYLVNHNYLDTLMAMKIVKEPLSIKTNKKDVFREVTLACQLRHENIINIYDAAEISVEDGKSHAYFLMEYVSGGDLGQYLNSFAENGIYVPIDRSLNLIMQILRGLNTLHSANPPIVHRDLKPNNVLLSFDASGDIIIKISDFGFAKEVTNGISDIDIAGTRPYMAPELFSKEVSTKSDIYAVGVIFYQLLTNLYPYDVDEYSNDDLIDLKPWDEELKPPSFYNGKVSGELDEIVMKCLSMDSSARYGDASEMLADVEKAVDEFRSTHIGDRTCVDDDYHDDYWNYPINDFIMEAFALAKCENRLPDAIEILEREVLGNYELRRFYSETLKIWKSQKPDLKLISKAFTVNLKARNYEISCNLLKEAIAYNPSLKSKYQDYIDLWEIFIDLNKHKSLFKAVMLLESLMESSSQINDIYKDIMHVLKTYSIEEIVVGAIALVKQDRLSDGANLIEFAVIVDSQIRYEYEYEMSLWKQNMRMHFKTSCEIKDNAVDYAIDLGTNDSVVSYFNRGDPIIIKNHLTGDDFTPSAILIDDDDNLEVGVNARDAIFENNKNAVSEFKHDMGFQVPFRFEKSSRVMFPEELSAEVLKDLRVSVYKQQAVNIEDAVICVPANSNPIKTRSIIDAAELAGFRSCNLILEPIAVSLAYNLKKSNGIWMIYDMGGATFNVTLIRENEGDIEKLATSGLDNLGGNMIDWKIVNDLFKPHIASDLNLDDFTGSNHKYLKEFARLKNAAEMAKLQLTNSDMVDVSVDNLFEGYDFRYSLNRKTFKQTIVPLIKHTFDLSRQLLDDNSLRDKDIDKIILVGGSTLSPIIQDLISGEFDAEIESSLNPLTVVARGASVYAGSIEKPAVKTEDEVLSLLLSYDDGQIAGRLFAHDFKSSFLDYLIEFENESSSTKIPLKIDGTFKFSGGSQNYRINVYNGDGVVDVDLKSPKSISDGKVYIPYFKREFVLDDSLNPKNIIGRYSKLLDEIEFLKDYTDFNENEIQQYIEMLLEILQRDKTAINQANIYIDYLESIIFDAKKDLEFSMLLENVLNKIEIIEKNNLFEMESITPISKSGDLDKLKEFYVDLVERYVALNRNGVIEQCFFNLKLEGIFTDNPQLAEQLIDKAQDALNSKDYQELFNLTNQLYELDERREAIS